MSRWIGHAPGTLGKHASVLVVGGGLAGMTTALYLAEWGAEVTLVERAPHMGGAFLHLDHTFTTDSCGLCLALPRQPSLCPTIATEDHPRIQPMTHTTLTGLRGEAGRFMATLRRAPRYVDPERCNSCGACAEVCTVMRSQVHRIAQPSWGRFLQEAPLRRKAIYPPVPRAVPTAYAIDSDVCTRCGACVQVCPHSAIDLGATGGEDAMRVEAVVLAPGSATFDAARAVEYGYGRCANVVTSLELERMLNRSGPTQGQILRPSDDRVPQRMAFIHCVGSRSDALERPYCSSFCCMITAKQVGMSHEAAPGAQLTVFTMDVRAVGKGYERYFQRVSALPRVTYRRGRPAAVHELPASRDLRLLTPEGEEVFDLLVLAVGMGPGEGAVELARAAGVEVDQHGFIVTGQDGPGSTSRCGVFCVGHSVEPGSGVTPADVPETVTQAAATAALTAGTLMPARERDAKTGRGAPSVSLPVEDEAVTAKGHLDTPPRIGVFLCSCQSDLNAQLDLAALAAASERLRGVSHVERVEAACESSGLRTIEHAALEHGLNRIIVAGCSPHLYADRFEELMERLELPSRLLSRANLREGAAWPFGEDRAAATRVGQGQIAMAIAALRETPDRPLAADAWAGAVQQAPTRRVLVLGGGLAGMTAALTLAELGVDCHLVEREAEPGGNLREAITTLAGLDARKLLRDTVDQVHRSDGVRLWTEAELLGWSGTQGDFSAEIRVRDEVRTERYGALVVATGAEAASTDVSSAAREYLYGRHPRVVTQRELERWIALGAKPAPVGSRLAESYTADGVHPRSVVMIQCVGSRDEEHPYCSRVCCAHAIKNALSLKRIDPTIEVSVLFRDIRTLGTRELYYREARRLGVHFIRYEPPRRPVVEGKADTEGQGDHVKVTVQDVLYDEKLTLQADLLVLSTGVVASAGNRPLAELLGVALDEDGFFSEVHPKLRPVDLPRPGLFVCGMAYGPRSITESMAQARAAALRAALTVVRPSELRQDVVTVEPKLCSFCGLCVKACPYGARVLDHEERVAQVLDALCQGCGACVALCPNGASRQPSFEPARALAVVDAALD